MNCKSLLLAGLLLAPFTSYALSAMPPYAEIVTNFGTILVELDIAKAPISSKNFISYALAGAYNNSLFHRSVKYSYDPVTAKGDPYGIIQTGGYSVYNPGAHIATTPAIINEAYNGLSNTAGTLGMARLDDPDSANSEFFFNVTDNSTVFDKTTTRPGYAVFGKVLADDYNLIKAINGFAALGRFLLTGSNTPALYTAAYIDRVYLSDFDPRSTTKVTVRAAVAADAKTTTLGFGTVSCGGTSRKSVCSTTKTISTTKKPSVLQLKATPLKNSAFTGWRGDCQGYKNPIILPLTRNYNCTATFIKTAP
jgi:peptidyl-prolyl cis-trans isomerase A (cyclophilin A)